MATYLLKHLASADRPLAVTVFEATSVAGVGMPYRAEMNADYMLCNAFSREIPAVTRSLLDWLKDRPKRELDEWELSAHDLTARAFYPRVLIGEYLQSEFEALREYASTRGHQVHLRTESVVTDILPRNGKPVIEYRTAGGSRSAEFDDVFIATGHVWDARPKIDGVQMVSSWPYRNITALEEKQIGVLGSSLSAIDVVIALGHARGVFDETGERVQWAPNDGSEGLRITMVSHTGTMPEADFYYPVPYEPLTILTKDAVEAEVARGPAGLLDRVFELLCNELDAADPAYLSGLPLSARTVEGFGPAWFERRRKLGGLSAVRDDLKRARRSLRQRETVPYRYVMLRGHAVFDDVLHQLTDDEYARFLAQLMPAFADCYAAVPLLSLARVIALYEAGVLDLVATRDGAKFVEVEDERIEVDTEDGPLQFDEVIDARGQSSAGLSELRHPSLVEAMPDRDDPLLEPFELEVSGLEDGRVFCLAIPQLLERHPFCQGLAECHELARIVAREALRV